MFYNRQQLKKTLTRLTVRRVCWYNVSTASALVFGRAPLMNNRERAMDILHCKSADRMPAVRFGCWQELPDEGPPGKGPGGYCRGLRPQPGG